MKGLPLDLVDGHNWLTHQNRREVLRKEDAENNTGMEAGVGTGARAHWGSVCAFGAACAESGLSTR